MFPLNVNFEVRCESSDNLMRIIGRAVVLGHPIPAERAGRRHWVAVLSVADQQLWPLHGHSL